nr:hypothetical protein Iba_chr14aCG6380 [Ipomoea batatas]
MQPYEEENTEDMKNKILAMIKELKQEMTNIREKLKQESRQRTSSLGQETQASIRTLEDQMAQVAKGGNEEEDTHDMTSENNYIIEDDVDNEVNLFNPCVFNDSDSFDSSDDDDENCFDTCENNSFVSLDDNDGLESFTFDDNALSNENVDDLHDMLFDDMNVVASLCDLNDVEIVNFLDNCFDDAMYIHNLIGKDRSEGVEIENVKEEVEDKKKTRNESVREEVEETSPMRPKPQKSPMWPP